jgi:hypothetical protein
MSVSRREFLKAGLTLAGAVLLDGCGGGAGSSVGSGGAGAAVSAPAQHSVLNLDALARTLNGRLLQPGEPGYLAAAIPNNQRYADILPKAVAVCANDADVALCLRWARDNAQKFAIRCGGHNYAGFSTTTGLLIDVKGMQTITLDPANGRVTVSAGANNESMAGAFRNTPFAVPSGRCPTVGVSGLTLGGGWGFACTHAGLTCDSLVESNVVLADTSLVTARAGGDTDDLFWAIRGGGGGNFGVNTSFTFRLADVSQPVTLFDVLWPGQRQVELFSALQKIQLDHDRDMGSRFKIFPDAAGANPSRSQLQVATLGLYYGTADQAREALAPALDLVTPLRADITQMGYWQARDRLVTDDPSGRYDLLSRYVEEGLSPQAIETMLTWMTRWPGGTLLPENMGIMFAIGGKVLDVPREATAYVHRTSHFMFEMEAAWTPADPPTVIAEQRAWLREYFAEMQQFLLPETYVCFPNRELTDWEQAYYGQNLSRLSEIKRKYDPSNVFVFEQSIPPA